MSATRWEWPRPDRRSPDDAGRSRGMRARRLWNAPGALERRALLSRLSSRKPFRHAGRGIRRFTWRGREVHPKTPPAGRASDPIRSVRAFRQLSGWLVGRGDQCSDGHRAGLQGRRLGWVGVRGGSESWRVSRETARLRSRAPRHGGQRSSSAQWLRRAGRDASMRMGRRRAFELCWRPGPPADHCERGSASVLRLRWRSRPTCLPLPGHAPDDNSGVRGRLAAVSESDRRPDAPP